MAPNAPLPPPHTHTHTHTHAHTLAHLTPNLMILEKHFLRITENESDSPKLMQK